MAAAKKAISAKKIKKAKKTKKVKTAVSAKKSVTKASKAAPEKPAPVTRPHPQTDNQGAAGIRVRMFRVGFGDFFLLSVPTRDGDKHILIDCGVHAKDLGTIQAAVAQMIADCGSELALVIMTHRHADHISGFAKCSDAFRQVAVDRVWMPWFENPKNKTAMAFQSSLSALANRLSIGLAARRDPVWDQFISMADNITGGMNAVGGGSANQKALDVLQNGFKNTPEHDYYQAGDKPVLPQSLLDAGLTVQILGPPIDPSLVSQMNYKAQQYLSDNAQSDGERFQPFPTAFLAEAADYPPEAFKFYSAIEITRLIDSVQPDVLAAQAMAADKTLNNQSLVLLFTIAGKTLLFAGDAQWGNWENFLYGGAFGTPGHTEITEEAKAILDKLDFYKVGHHGSTNATPKDAVAHMRLGCAGMCSTQIGAYNQVPREPLLQALRDRMDGQLARSDQVAASPDEGANPDAGPLSLPFTAPTRTLFIDYVL
jgi:beta-lactamase superfamily II metal-dependent hydrolase